MSIVQVLDSVLSGLVKSVRPVLRSAPEPREKKRRPTHVSILSMSEPFPLLRFPQRAPVAAQRKGLPRPVRPRSSHRERLSLF